MSQQIVLTPFEQDNKFFIKTFLLDASLNQNGWWVEDEALKQHIGSFKGKPFVVTEEFGHPDEKVQENYRKGTILEAGIDQSSGKAYAVIEVTDKVTIELIKKGELQFVSPSIGADEEDVSRFDGKITVKAFTGYHLAGVKQPAYGVYKAQIKGQCSGSSHTCQRQLMTVQACAGCGTFSKEDVVSSLNPPSPKKLLMGDAVNQIVDYSPQIKELTASVESLKKEINTRDETISQLNAKLEKEIKRPSIERILSAKVELGKIKAEETQTEADRLNKLDASELTLIASELEAVTKSKKEVPAYRIQHSASAQDAPKNGDEWLRNLKRAL